MVLLMPKLMKRYVAPVALFFVISDRWQVRSGEQENTPKKISRAGAEPKC
jgi:hypothetical protein